MNISPNDLMRIALEQSHLIEDEVEENHRDAADGWALRQGMEEGTMAMIAGSVIDGYERCVIDLTREWGSGESEIEVNGDKFVEANPQAALVAMEMAVLSAFRWGWESAKQLTHPNSVGEKP